MSSKVTVSANGRITLPAEARRRLGIEPGAKLEIIIHDDTNRLEVIRIGGSIRDLKGALPKPKRTLSLAQMDKAIARGAARSKR